MINEGNPDAAHDNEYRASGEERKAYKRFLDTPAGSLQGLTEVQVDEDGCCYGLQMDSERAVVDPRKKGEPGDIVVVWPRKKGPIVTRRLARCAPYNTDRPF